MPEGEDRSLQMLATALEKEETGKEFYSKAATTCINDLCKEVFAVLSTEEEIHIKRIKEIYEALRCGGSWTCDWKADSSEVENLRKSLREKTAGQAGREIRKATTDLEAVEVGLEFEQRAIAFYEEEFKRAAEPLNRAFMEQMIAEERSHYASLSDMKLYLTDPDSWFVEVERHGLDGA